MICRFAFDIRPTALLESNAFHYDSLVNNMHCYCYCHCYSIIPPTQPFKMEEIKIKPVNKRIEKVEKAKKKKAVDASKKGKKKKKKDDKARSKTKKGKDREEYIDMNAVENDVDNNDDDDDLLLWAREPELFEEKKATSKKSKKKKENQEQGQDKAGRKKINPEIKRESPKGLEARKREVQEKASAKLKAREQELLKERLERERRVQLELDRIDQRSAKVKAMQEEIAIQEKFERNARAKMDRQKSARLLQKMRQEQAQEKDLENAKKAAIKSAYNKAERIQQEALKKQKLLEEQLAAAAIQAKEQKEKSMRASEQAAKWSLEQERKLQEIVNDKKHREQQADEAAKSRMAKKNKIKNKEMERQQALAAAKSNIDRRAEELKRDAMERQQKIQAQLEVEALASHDDEEEKDEEEQAIMEDMERVAEESKKLDQIIRNKERWERESKRRLSCSTNTTLGSPVYEKQKEAKALAIAKGNIERKKSELKRDAKKRQQRIRAQLEEVLALSDDEEDISIVMDRELLEDIEKVTQEGKKLEEIVRNKERRERERESKRRLSCTDIMSSRDDSNNDMALAAAKAKIEQRKLELQRDANTRQERFQDQLEENESEDEGAVEILERLLIEDMEHVAEESMKLEQIVREKERWERQSMRRLALSSSRERDEESKETKALAAAKAKIEAKKSELVAKQSNIGAMSLLCNEQRRQQQQQQHLENENKEIDFETMALEEEFMETQSKLQQIEAMAKLSFLVPRAA